MRTKREHEHDESDDPLIRQLHRLAVTPKRALLENIFDRYVVVSGPLSDAFVVFGAEGVRSVTLIEGQTDTRPLIEAYEQRFGRPITLAESAPGALSKSIQSLQSRVAIDLSVLTPFEQAVLNKTAEIPRGEVRPYGWIAAEIGRPKAVRATGSALARNPVPLLIPCHRVVKSDGALGNYGYGTPMKAALLRHEGVDLDALIARTTRRVRFVGSDTTHVVCYPTCRSPRRISAHHEVDFTSLDDAREAGFRPCTLCRPVESPL